MIGKLGQEALGDFKLGDVLRETAPTPGPSPIGGQLIRGVPRLFDDYDEDVAIAFVLTQV